MKDRSHIIKRQVLEIEVDSKEKADAALEKFKEDYYSLYLAAIDQVLDELPAGDSISIDEILLDIGDIYPDDSQEEVGKRIAANLRGALGLAPAEQPVSAAKKKVVTVNEKRLEILEHFLRFGTYPWWASHAEDTITITRELIAETPAELRSILIKCVSGAEPRKRMCAQFDEDMLEEFLRIINPSLRPGIKKLAADLAPALISAYQRANASAASAREILWSTALAAAAFTQNESAFAQAMLRGLTHAVKAIDPGNDKERKLVDIFSLHGLITEQATYEEQQLNSAEAMAEVHDDRDARVEVEKEYDRNAGLVPDKDAPTEWFIQNSGLCILSPYLQLFFTRLGLVHKNEFIDREKQDRAIHILQYAVTGDEAAAEHSLAFNKLLCGLKITEPISRFINLTNEEKAECEALLSSIIKNWDALRSTSVDGLRHSFLLRKGILKQDELSWVLKAERKTYDMMMNKMPWSFSAIKLPWNEHAIQVQW